MYSHIIDQLFFKNANEVDQILKFCRGKSEKRKNDKEEVKRLNRNWNKFIIKRKLTELFEEVGYVLIGWIFVMPILISIIIYFIF